MSRSLRVLVVDDEFLIADYIALTLQDAGHRVVGTAASVTDALHVAGTAEIDLAILDIKLRGEEDGIDLAQRLGPRGIPHLFISGSRDAAVSPRAQATKPLAFLQKPFDPARLLAVLAGLGEPAQP